MPLLLLLEALAPGETADPFQSAGEQPLVDIYGTS